MSSVRNIFRTFLTSMTSSMEETQNVLCKRNTEYVPMENMLPHVKSVLLMPSPLIKINTHCADEKNDLHKLLQFTPGEGKFNYYSIQEIFIIFSYTQHLMCRIYYIYDLYSYT